MMVPARLMKLQPRSQVACSTLFTAGHMVGGQLHYKRRGLAGKGFQLFEHDAADDDGDYADEVGADSHKAAAAEQRAGKQADNGHFCAAGHKAGGHDGHAAVTFIFNGTGRHNARHAAAGTDEHWDEAFAGKAELAEDTVHNKGDTGHIAHVFQNGKHQEQHQHLRHKAQHGGHAAHDAVHHQGPAASGATLQLSSRPPMLPCRNSAPNTSFVQSVKKLPNGPMAIQYTSHITTTKMGSASTRFVTMRSILSEADRLCLAAFFFTHLSTTLLM